MIKIPLNANTVFSLLLLTVFSIVLYRFIPPSIDKNIELVLQKNRSDIQNINQERKISDTRTYFIERVNLNKKGHFIHPKLGTLGWKNNFFADIKSEFEVTKPSKYRFIVGSDDGFSLRIDGEPVCSFDTGRAFKRQTCTTQLTKGDHTLKLSYYQGLGQAGLTLQYKAQGRGKRLFWGDSSKYLKIKKP